jgi:hypothetical protein
MRRLYHYWIQGKKMELNKETMIADMEAARNRLDLATKKVSPQVEIYPSWQLKQLMDHLTGWDVLVAALFRAHARGESDTLERIKSINRYNADSVAERHALSLDQSRQAYQQARADVIQALREMPEDRLAVKVKPPWGGTCTVASVVKIFVDHENKHARQLVLNNQ